MSPSLWDWAVEAYARPGVAERLIALQDTAGQNVPLLLWAAWNAATGRTSEAEALEAARDVARAWDEAAVSPLRAVRRRLKAPLPDLDPSARERIREAVKRVELEAEHALLDALAALAPPPSGRPRSPLESMAAVARAWNGRVPREALSDLAERLST